MRINQVLFFTSGLAACGVAVFWFETRHSSSSAPLRPVDVVRSSSPGAAPEPFPVAEAAPSPALPARAMEASPGAAASDPVPAAPVETAKTADEFAVEQTAGLLISPETSFLQKQAAWDAMRNDPGQIDRTIALLEQRAQEDPRDAEIPAQLGLAYLMKISTSQDVREQGMGGMKADLSFDTALKLDPSNWSVKSYLTPKH